MLWVESMTVVFLMVFFLIAVIEVRRSYQERLADKDREIERAILWADHAINKLMSGDMRPFCRGTVHQEVVGTDEWEGEEEDFPYIRS